MSAKRLEVPGGQTTSEGGILSRSMWRGGGLIVLVLLALPFTASAQEDSVVVRAGVHYSAGDLHEILLGEGYRDLWSTPIRVPLLMPDTFAGGLTVLQRGGGLQTASLRFVGADGAQYVFRSVDKDQSGGLHPDLRRTLVSAIAQDQVSAKHPASALVVAPLLAAAGVMHASPRLVVLGDHPLLGEHREEFAGMLGIIEERPEDVNDGGDGFGGFPLIIGSERLLERLTESHEDRVAPAPYLRARLMDLLVGDWDRHPDQWRWAQDDRKGRRYWLPIPRDRDNAFSDVTGVVAAVAAAFRPNVVEFGPEYPDLYAMLHNAQLLDRRILPHLSRDEWARIASELAAVVTDEVIAQAVERLPLAYHALDSADLARNLRARRDALPAVALEMYELLASEVEVHGTAEVDLALVERDPTGVTVRLREEGPTGAVYFERHFRPEETREIRLLLNDGDDTATVRGAGGRILVRVLGGGGDDVVVDSAAATARGRTLVFDDRGENEVDSAARRYVDSRAFAEPSGSSITENNAPPPRDWGSSHSLLSPTADWVSSVGPVVGAGPAWTRYGFRRFPYATRTEIALLYAPLVTRFGVEAGTRHLLTGGGGETRIRARATSISVTNFNGYGNETVLAPSSLRRVWANELGAEVEIERELGGGLSAYAGPVVRYLDPSPPENGPALKPQTPGVRAFGIGGGRLVADYDGRDSESYPRSGVRIEIVGEGYPLVWGDAPEAFATSQAVGSAYLPLPSAATLALRAGAERVWGRAPLQHAAYLGGSSTLRGYRTQRFAGDAAAFAGAELRVALGRMNLLVARGDVGVLGLVDAGRVWWSEEESGGWHSGFGGGFWFGPFDRTLTGHVTWAYGESHTFSAGIGMPF